MWILFRDRIPNKTVTEQRVVWHTIDVFEVFSQVVLTSKAFASIIRNSDSSLKDFGVLLYLIPLINFGERFLHDFKLQFWVSYFTDLLKFFKLDFVISEVFV